MSATTTDQTHQYVDLHHEDGRADIVLVCEHASSFIPPSLNDLGLAQADRDSHAAWDPGALAVAKGMAGQLDAVLVAGAVSRLVFDCNRPPGAPDAIPAQSERIAVPGNVGIGDVARDGRARTYYEPFKTALAGTIAKRAAPVIVTLHSFTPVYNGAQRSVEIGLLHDADSRLADAMFGTAAQQTGLNVQRNAPYGPQDGVTHTLKVHAIPQGLLNVMIEVRNDLIATAKAQKDMAHMLSVWISAALEKLRGGQHG